MTGTRGHLYMTGDCGLCSGSGIFSLLLISVFVYGFVWVIFVSGVRFLVKVLAVRSVLSPSVGSQTGHHCCNLNP